MKKGLIITRDLVEEVYSVNSVILELGYDN